MIHVSNIGEIIDIQCKKDVKKVEFSYFCLVGEGKQSLTPSPLLSSFRRLHEQLPMVPRRGRGVVSSRLIWGGDGVDKRR